MEYPVEYPPQAASEVPEPRGRRVLLQGLPHQVLPMALRQVTSVGREMVFFISGREKGRKKNPVQWEVKREKKNVFPLSGKWKEKKLHFPTFWEVQREKLNVFPLIRK